MPIRIAHGELALADPAAHYRIAIHVIGGPLPDWAERQPSQFKNGALRYVILRERLPAKAVTEVLTQPTSQEETFCWMLIADEMCERELMNLSPFKLAVTASLKELDVAAEALARVVGGKNYIGVSVDDLFAMSCGDGETSKLGRAKVVYGAANEEGVSMVARKLDELASGGFDGPTIFIAMHRDEEAFDLRKFASVTPPCLARMPIAARPPSSIAASTRWL